MSWIVTLLALGLLLTPLIISIRRGTELFKVRIRNGKAIFLRGRIPQALLDDINDIVRAPPVPKADVRAVRRAGKPRLEASGELTPDQRQQLRNVLGTYSLQRIMAGGRRR
jgi:hypothetical protein